jgi:Ca2+-transporting ATPase
MTITLAIGVARMARRRAIIRKLPAVEALGSTTVICSDKTGTLTENEMTVTAIEAGGASYTVSGAGYGPEGEVSGPAGRAAAAPGTALGECLRAGLLCNDAALAAGNGRASVQGDPTEAALLVTAAKAGLVEDEEKRRFPRLDAIPFESEHRYMATLHDAGPGRPRPVYLKGSVEAVLGRCAVALGGGGEAIPLDAGAVHASAEAMAARGLRVLAFARGELPPGATTIRHEDVARGLVFLGLQGMIDPPRAAAVAAVETCRRAGIEVKMITGDHAATATAIAKQVGIAAAAGDGGAAALTGREIELLSAADLAAAAARTAVFARVSPEQKLRLVEALQAEGHVVAMTGDGVNDAPALKRADIGVAMGLAGTDAAREAADMVLTDDDFATIAAAVEEGRGVFDNLTKFIVWTLPTNLGEGLVILAAVIAGTTLPILPVQILWINMTTAVLLGLSLAFEAKERDIMARPPRDPRAPILTAALVGRIVLVGGFLLAGAFGLFEWMIARGATIAQARTVAVNVFVVVELAYLLNCRSLGRSMFHVGLFSNPWLIGGAMLMVALELAFTYTPAMNRLFQSAPVDLASWAAAIGVAAAASAAVGLEKMLRRAWGRAPAPAVRAGGRGAGEAASPSPAARA